MKMKRLSCTFFALVFFISFSFPHYEYAFSSTPVSEGKSEQTESSDGLEVSAIGYKDVLTFKEQLLTPIVLEMSQALGELHIKYAEIFKFWHLLLEHIPETDRRGSQVLKLLHETEITFSALNNYSQTFHAEISKINAGRRTAGKLNFEKTIDQLASTITLLGTLERLCQYEVLSQDLLADLYRMGKVALSDYVGSAAFQKLSDFEKVRKDQLTKYFKARLQYESSIRILSAFESLYNTDTRKLFQDQAQYYLSLSNEISNRNETGGSQSSNVLTQEAIHLAEKMAREILAIGATFTEGDNGKVWSLLYSPLPGHKTTNSKNDLNQKSVARTLVNTLEDMRVPLRDLVNILLSRNKVFFDDIFIEDDRLEQLRESIALETVRLFRFQKIDLEIKAAELSLDEVIKNDRVAGLYSEIGYLKEDILSFESSILQELLFLNENEIINTHPKWQLISDYIDKQRQWNQTWPNHAKAWKNATQVFNDYQLGILKRSVKSLKKITSGVYKVRQDSSFQKNGNIELFIKFLDDKMLRLLAETQEMLLQKQEMIDREEKDPIFASLFGINSERFWHDFRGQGSALWRQEILIQSAEIVLDRLHALSQMGENDTEWALPMVKIAKDLNLISDIELIEDDISVVIGSGTETLILKGLLSPKPPILEVSFSNPKPPLNENRLFHTLASVFSPQPVHAGFLSGMKKWGSAVVNQASKNMVNYVVIGAIAVGSLAAGPAAPAVLAVAAAAFKAQATADTAIATARTAGDALVSDPNIRKTMHGRIDKLETAYNIAKIVEGGRNLWKGTSGQDEIIDQAGKFSERISGTLDDMLSNQGKLLQKISRVKDYLLKTSRSSETMKRGMQILSGLAEEAVGRGKDIANVTSNIGKQVDKFIAMAQAGAKANEAGGVLATLSGLLSGSDDKKPSNPDGSTPSEPKPGEPNTAAGTKPNENNAPDSDGDGTPDSKDGCAADPKKTFPGQCGCGTPDTDSDGDNTPDCKDKCPNDANKTEPGMCDCGTPDTDSDGDNTPDCKDKCPNDADKTEAGKCGCGKPDTDEDRDGTLDCNDNCPRDPEKTEPGECGCGTPDDDSNVNGVADCTETKDSDGDTIPDVNDRCPQDPKKTEPGECGCGIPDDDSNVNGVADCKETKKSGCSSNSDCPKGYVCNAQSGQCMSPFDENYTSRNQTMASNEQERQRENTEQNIADTNLDPNDGGYTSEQLGEEINRTQETMTAECGPRKPCPDSKNYECVEGKCVKREEGERPECRGSNECPEGKECEDGKCITKSECKSDGECPSGEKCENGKCVKKAECDNNEDCPSGQKCQNGKCVKTGCSSDNECKKGYRCKNGKCVKKGCTRNSECKKGYRCKNGKCVKIPSKPPASSGSCSVGPDNNGDGVCDVCGKRYAK